MMHVASQGGEKEGDLDKWVYKTKAELDLQCPSRKDQLDPQKIKLWRRQMIKVVRDAGVSLRVPQWCISVAATLCYRFYSIKSMKKNDRYLIAQACLHLALKMEESPKAIRDVVKECLRVRLGKQNSVLRKALEPEQVEKEKEETLVAERSVLYTLGFDLKATHPYKYLVKTLTDLRLNSKEHVEPQYANFMQNTWNFLNDSIRTDLVLQYKPQKLCSGALFLANAFNKHMHPDNKGDIMHLVRKYSKEPPGDFFQTFDITPQEAHDIARQILDLYEDAKVSEDQRRPAAPPATNPNPNIPTPMHPGLAPTTPSVPGTPYTPSHSSVHSSVAR